MNIKIRVCQIIGPAAAGSAGPVPTALYCVPELCRLFGEVQIDYFDEYFEWNVVLVNMKGMVHSCS